MLATIEDLRHAVTVVSDGRPELARRLERAAVLLPFRHIVDLGEGRYRVQSEDGLRWYGAKEGECTCQDARRHGPHYLCKHALAVSLGLPHREA